VTRNEQRLADLERRLSDLNAELAIQRELVFLLLDLRTGVRAVPMPKRHLQVIWGGGAL
jgi:hypothetical protein